MDEAQDDAEVECISTCDRMRKRFAHPLPRRVRLSIPEPANRVDALVFLLVKDGKEESCSTRLV